MTSSLVISELFYLFFFVPPPPPTLDLKKSSCKLTNEKFWPESQVLRGLYKPVLLNILTCIDYRRHMCVCLCNSTAKKWEQNKLILLTTLLFRHLIGGRFRGRQPWWLLCFIYNILVNHEFWYQFRLNRLKYVEVMGLWIFANGL